MKPDRTARGESLLVAGAALALGFFVVALALQSAWWQVEAERGAAMGIYWLAYALLWSALTLLAVRLWRSRRTDALADKPPVAHASRTGLLIFLVALVARIAVVLLTEPILSDDIWRYIHDGATLAGGENPYARAPTELSANEAPAPELLGWMNNPRLVTIYQPASQWIFAALWSLHPSRIDPLAIDTFRFGFAAFDMAIVMMLLIAVRRAGRSPWWAAMYAWHPLAIGETAASGHQDPIGIALLLACVVLLEWRAKSDAQPQVSSLRAAGAGAAFALAVAVKPIVAPLALSWARWLAGGRSVGDTGGQADSGARRGTADTRPWHPSGGAHGRLAPLAVAAGAALLVGAAMYLPFAMMPGGVERMLDTAETFVGLWAWNASAFAVLLTATGSFTWAKLIAGGALLAVLVVMTWRRVGPSVAALAYLFAGVLLSTTVHPWYLLWPLALLPIAAPRLPLAVAGALWLASLTIGWSYTAHLNEAGFHPFDWIVWLEYVPVYAVLAAGLVYGYWRRSLRQRSP